MTQEIECFLIGINRVFILIRFKINEAYVISILEVILEFAVQIMEKKSIKFTAFTEKLLNIKELDEYSKEFLLQSLKVDCKPKNTNESNEVIKYLPIIIYTAGQIIDNLKINNYNKSYDLVDVIHCLPELLLKKKWNPKDYWKTFIIPYRLKWDKDFLISMEKETIPKGFFKSILR